MISKSELDGVWVIPPLAESVPAGATVCRIFDAEQIAQKLGRGTAMTLQDAGPGRLQIFVNDQLGQTHVLLTGELDLATVGQLAERRGINPEGDVVIDSRCLLTWTRPDWESLRPNTLA